MSTEDVYVSLASLQSTWQGTANTAGVKDPNTQQLLAGMNFRVDARMALKAIYLTTKLYLTGKLALVTGDLGPEEMATLGKDLFDVVVTTLNALRERLRRSTYAACVVLAASPDGMTPAELETGLTSFLEGLAPAKLPFYMGFSENFVTEAHKEINSPRAFDELLTDLRKGKWVTESEGRLFFKARHFVWTAPTSS